MPFVYTFSIFNNVEISITFKYFRTLIKTRAYLVAMVVKTSMQHHSVIEIPAIVEAAIDTLAIVGTG